MEKTLYILIEWNSYDDEFWAVDDEAADSFEVAKQYFEDNHGYTDIINFRAIITEEQWDLILSHLQAKEDAKNAPEILDTLDSIFSKSSEDNDAIKK